jgi:hypothetical protein
MAATCTQEEARRRGQTAINFYREIRSNGSEDLEYFRVPPPHGLRSERDLLARLRKVLYLLFAP